MRGWETAVAPCGSTYPLPMSSTKTPSKYGKLVAVSFLV